MTPYSKSSWWTILVSLIGASAIIVILLSVLHSAPLQAATDPDVKVQPVQYVLEVMVAKTDDPNENALLFWRDPDAPAPKVFDTKAECDAFTSTDLFKDRVSQLVAQFTAAGIKVVTEYGCFPKPDSSI
jgi:hypothetical protein